MDVNKYCALNCCGQRSESSIIRFRHLLNIILTWYALGHKLYFLYLNNLNDKTKTANITPALTRNVIPPNILYNSPPVVNPMILATPVTLPATPCTAP